MEIPGINGTVCEVSMNCVGVLDTSVFGYCGVGVFSVS